MSEALKAPGRALPMGVSSLKPHLALVAGARLCAWAALALCSWPGPAVCGLGLAVAMAQLQTRQSLGLPPASACASCLCPHTMLVLVWCGCEVLVLRIAWSAAVCGCDTFSEEAAPGSRGDLGAAYVCLSTHPKGPDLVR